MEQTKPKKSTKPQKPIKTLIALVIALVMMFVIAACTASAGDVGSSADTALSVNHAEAGFAPVTGVSVNFENFGEAGTVAGAMGGQSL